jgi:NAD-dependent SIR2 family protein deacetylase
VNETGLGPAAVDAAAQLIGAADALLVCAGAGMGVDSGLPDFRGSQGFWQAYPPYARLGLSFADMADAARFAADPGLAWGFYGHRLRLYRAAVPHAGFGLLRSWGERMAQGVRVLTSNVDGQFQRAGFGNVVEVHGSIHYFQCLEQCSEDVWPAGGFQINVEETTMRAASPLPHCRRCARIARPNILMFGDWSWVARRTSAQEDELAEWLHEVAVEGSRLAVVELGAGRAIPTVRMRAEHLAASIGGRRGRAAASLIRINPDPADAAVPGGAGVSLTATALAALTAIDARLRSSTQPSAASPA